MYTKRRALHRTICTILTVLIVLAIPTSGLSLSPKTSITYGSSFDTGALPNTYADDSPWGDLPNLVEERVATTADIENSPSIESVSMTSYDIFNGDQASVIRLNVRPGKGGVEIAKVTITVAKYNSKGDIIELDGVDSYPVETLNIFRYTADNNNGEQCVQDVHNMSIEDVNGNVTFYFGQLSKNEQTFKTYDDNTSQLTLDYYDSNLRLLFKLYSQTAGDKPVVAPALPDYHDGKGYGGIYGISYFQMLEDNFSFPNHPKSFGYQAVDDDEEYDYKYRVPKERYTELFGKSYGKSLYRQIKKWDGSCFGINAVNLTFFNENLNYSTYSPNPDPRFIYDINAPVEFPIRLTQLIETYHIGQFDPGVISSLGWLNKNNLEKLLEEVQLFQDGIPGQAPIINIGAPKVGGHSIIAYAAENVGLDSERKFELYIYDNTWPDDTTRRMPIDLDTGEWSYILGINGDGNEVKYSSESENDYITFVSNKQVFDAVEANNAVNNPNGLFISSPVNSSITDDKGTDIANIPGAYEAVQVRYLLESSQIESRMFVAPNGSYTIKSPTDSNETNIFSNGEAFFVSAKGDNSEISFSSTTESLAVNSTEGFELELWNDLTADDSITLSTSSTSDLVVSQEKTDIKISSNSGSPVVTAKNSTGSKEFSLSAGESVKITDKLDVTPYDGTTAPNNKNTITSSSNSEGSSKVDISPNISAVKEVNSGVIWLDSSTLKFDGNKATLRYTGKFGLKKDAFNSLSEKQLVVDTVEGSIVKVRISIPNPSLLTSDTVLSATVSGNEVNRIKNIFTRSFKNQIAVISLDNKEPWKQNVKVYAKVDLDKMDKDNLKFYSYNAITNRYKEIIASDYKIDKNGYVVFTTNTGGEIIISSGSLAK